MTRTRYHDGRANDSNKAHELARKVIYPKIFGADFERLQFENTLLALGDGRGTALDADFAIDRVVKVNAIERLRFKMPLPFTIQERFRKAKYRNKFEDVTITEWNHASGKPAEFYKMAANLFVYGYHNVEFTKFIDCIAFWTGPVWLALINGRIKFNIVSNNGKNQSFIAIPLSEFHRVKAVVYHMNGHLYQEKVNFTNTKEALSDKPLDWVRARGKLILACKQKLGIETMEVMRNLSALSRDGQIYENMTNEQIINIITKRQ